jgi:hypothetical protein
MRVYGSGRLRGSCQPPPRWRGRDAPNPVHCVGQRRAHVPRRCAGPRRLAISYLAGRHASMSLDGTTGRAAGGTQYVVSAGPGWRQRACSATLRRRAATPSCGHVRAPMKEGALIHVAWADRGLAGKHVKRTASALARRWSRPHARHPDGCLGVSDMTRTRVVRSRRCGTRPQVRGEPLPSRTCGPYRPLDCSSAGRRSACSLGRDSPMYAIRGIQSLPGRTG